ncbi:hypothetical protein RUM44_002551 [Polyplax serrata]|uniref:Sorting nexin-17 n=1 Tax=Polyplax serrata TaxID=468196 RepID=A0ABR1AGF5_POLSC
MHFSVPDCQEFRENGASYTGFNIHVNGIFHCTVRYRQLHSLHEQIKKDFGSAAAQLPAFPSKKILPLSGSQLEERRVQLEKYIQAVGQEPILCNSELFNAFLSIAQQETSGLVVENTSIDVFLMNGYKISLNIQTNERSDHILEKVCEKLDLPDEYTYYFALFLIKQEDDSDVTIIRRLQDFESPYISQQSIKCQSKIVLRKSYWDSGYDLELMTHKVSLNLLYIQTVSDIQNGWVLCSQETRNTLANLQSRGAKKQYLELARTLKYYGFLQFRPCVCDYPYPGSKVLVSAGNKELNLRVKLTEGDDMRQGSFKVTRMRCWRITTLYSDDPKNPESSNLELSFEYLMAKDKLQWITISSEQAILMSICLQSMVDELLLKKSGVRRKTIAPVKSNNWSYIKRDGSSQTIKSVSQFGSGSELSSSSGQNGRGSSDSVMDVHGQVYPSHKVDAKSMKRLSDKFQSVGFNNNAKSLVKNECFDNDGIGDDDL